MRIGKRAEQSGRIDRLHPENSTTFVYKQDGLIRVQFRLSADPPPAFTDVVADVRRLKIKKENNANSES